MFYSHEILTQRKYGVATIWLVATLGSKSGLKKVLRRDILGVNVPKACATVMQPDAPLALRLQSNLLYGISRVYSGQCDYLISDASMAHANIKRMIAATIKAANLDLTSGGRARPDQLVLADDPSFLPDLNITQLPDGIDFDMDEAGALLNLEEDFGISSISFDRDSSVQNSARMSSRVGSILGTPQLDLMIATSDTAAGDYEFIPGPGLEDEDDRFLEDVGFEFDADGQMRELPMPPSEIDSMTGGKIASIGPSRRGRAGSVQSIGRGSRMGSEEAAAQVLREHEDGRGGRGLGPDDDDNLYAPPEDNGFDLPDGAEGLSDHLRGLSTASGSGRPSAGNQTEAEAEDVPVQRRRGPRATKFIIDEKTELRNADMKEWRDNYLQNMEAALERSWARKATRKAKSNANILVFEYGFFGTLRNPILKNLFSAKALLETICGGAEGVKKRKRVALGMEDGEEQGLDGEDEEGRRIRARMEDDGEIGLSDPQGEYELPMNPRFEDGVEVAREGPEGMSDGVRPSSTAALPWNIMSDRAGKSRAGSLMSGGAIMLPSAGGFPSSSMGGSQIGSQIGSQVDFASRRASRLSAIKGGAERLSVLGSPIGERDEEALGDLDQEFPAPGEEMEFEYFGVGANVDTQTAQDSQWLAATVEQESTNFFEFLKAEHAKCNQQAEEEGEEPAAFITFEQLLDPAQNGKIVAAQAFHHTLLLATKGLVYVSQEESYGSIQISIF